MARLGEDLAASFLQGRGARLLGRNLRRGNHEIDLLVRSGGKTIAVEVKTRTAGGQDPREAFTEEKAVRVRQAVRRLGLRVDRIDLVAVTLAPGGATIRLVPYAG